MHFSLSHLVFAALVGSPVLGLPSHGKHWDACLTDHEAADIGDRWDHFFVGHWGPLERTLASGFQAFNEDFTDGKNVPWAKSRDDYYRQISDGLDPTKSDDVQYDTASILTLHTCDTIVIRWQGWTKTTKRNEKKTGVKAGTKVTYKGTDIVTVDLKTRKITKVVASSDNVNHGTQLGKKWQ